VEIARTAIKPIIAQKVKPFCGIEKELPPSVSPSKSGQLGKQGPTVEHRVVLLLPPRMAHEKTLNHSPAHSNTATRNRAIS
jgi:hypothetical protein